jgi:hypothetical protein
MMDDENIVVTWLLCIIAPISVFFLMLYVLSPGETAPPYEPYEPYEAVETHVEEESEENRRLRIKNELARRKEMIKRAARKQRKQNISRQSNNSLFGAISTGHDWRRATGAQRLGYCNSVIQKFKQDPDLRNISHDPYYYLGGLNEMFDGSEPSVMDMKVSEAMGFMASASKAGI